LCFKRSDGVIVLKAERNVIKTLHQTPARVIVNIKE
jgi:hypothetical protein